MTNNEIQTLIKEILYLSVIDSNCFIPKTIQNVENIQKINGIIQEIVNLRNTFKRNYESIVEDKSTLLNKFIKKRNKRKKQNENLKKILKRKRWKINKKYHQKKYNLFYQSHTSLMTLILNFKEITFKNSFDFRCVRKVSEFYIMKNFLSNDKPKWFEKLVDKYTEIRKVYNSELGNAKRTMEDSFLKEIGLTSYEQLINIKKNSLIYPKYEKFKKEKRNLAEIYRKKTQNAFYNYISTEILCIINMIYEEELYSDSYAKYWNSLLTCPSAVDNSEDENFRTITALKTLDNELILITFDFDIDEEKNYWTNLVQIPSAVDDSENKNFTTITPLMTFIIEPN